jgi:hypothetical protein
MKTSRSIRGQALRIGKITHSQLARVLGIEKMGSQRLWMTTLFIKSGKRRSGELR